MKVHIYEENDPVSMCGLQEITNPSQPRVMDREAHDYNRRKPGELCKTCVIVYNCTRPFNQHILFLTK